MNDEQQNNMGPGMNPEPVETTDNSNNGSAGPIIGAILILALIVLGGLYFWSQGEVEEMDTADEVNTEEMVESINTQSDSDDISSIEADLEATDIDNLDSEINF